MRRAALAGLFLVGLAGLLVVRHLPRAPESPPRSDIRSFHHPRDPDPAFVPSAGVPPSYAGLGTRLRVARDLARLGPTGLAALRTAIADEDPAVRTVGALALLEPEHPTWEDLASLGVLLRDRDGGVRVAAGLALLDALDDEVPDDEIYGAADVLAALAQSPVATKEEAARAVHVLLAADLPRASARLLQGLPEFARPAVCLLREMLADGDVRRDAMDLLGFCGASGAAALPDLDPARYEDCWDRRHAAMALLRLGHRLDDALRVLASDPSDVDRVDLWVDDWRPVLPLLRWSLSGLGPIPPESALRLVRALGPQAAECLPEILRLRGSSELLPAAICALASIGPAASPAIPWVLETSEEHGVAGFWTDDLPPPSVPPIEEYRYEPWNPFGGPVRFRRVSCRQDVAALRAAARIAPCDPGVVRMLLRRLEDPDPFVREAATLSLRGAITGSAPLLGSNTVQIAPDAVHARLALDPDARVRAAAAAVLGYAATFGSDVAAAALAKELEEGDAEHAARALAMAGDFDRLEHALVATRARTRAWAAAAIFDAQVRIVGAGWRQIMHALERDDVQQRSDAAAAIEACLTDPDPALRCLAVHVIGNEPERFPDRASVLATAQADPDEEVRFVARCWEHVAWCEESGPAPGYIDELAAQIRGRALRAPVDLVLAGADPATLAAIARDGDLLPFERWFAARALR